MENFTTTIKTLSILLLFFATIIANASTNYVSKTGGNIPPYDSWANAATTIQTAVSASGSEDTILIGDGTYFPTNQIELRDNRNLVSLNGAKNTVKSISGYSGKVYSSPIGSKSRANLLF